LVVAATGCNDPTYIPEKRPLETQPGMMGMGFTADTDLFVVPVRQPTKDEKKALTALQMKKMLTMAVPWVSTGDFEIEIEWSLKNLEADKVQAQLSLNGGNEFGDYVPALYVDPTANQEDQTPPPPLLGGTPIDLAAGEVRTGVFREDDLQEAALDLEAITRYPSPGSGMNAPFEVIEHNSTVSRIGLEGIPAGDVTPAMVRMSFLLSATGHVVVDYNVRVRDLTGKLALPTDKNLYVSTAATLQAPAAPMPMAATPTPATGP
jgi:hypothetical protein